MNLKNTTNLINLYGFMNVLGHTTRQYTTWNSKMLSRNIAFKLVSILN